MSVQPSVVEKPKSVVIATRMLWVSIAFGILEALSDLTKLEGIPADFALYLLTFSFLLFGFLFFNISAGRNWARVTFCVMYVLGNVPSLPYLLEKLSRSEFAWVFWLGQTALQAVALFLLFTNPGKSWFSKVPKEPITQTDNNGHLE